MSEVSALTQLYAFTPNTSRLLSRHWTNNRWSAAGLILQGAAERTPRFGRGIASGGERVQWWGARRWTTLYVPFLAYTMAWLGEHRAFIVEEFMKNGGSPVATQRAFCIRFALGRREAVPDKKTIYRWISNFRQTGQTLEALKEAIRKEVAAITPEMILKVMDN